MKKINQSIRLVFASICCVLLFYGCTVSPTADQLAAADCGPRPSDSDAEQLIKSWMDANLKDPMSAQYQFLPLKKDCYLLNGMTRYYAWSKGTLVNAKNSYGGYTGSQPYIFYFRGNEITLYATPDGRMFDKTGTRAN